MSGNSRGLVTLFVMLSCICEHNVSEGNRAPTCQLTASEGSLKKFAKQKQKARRMIHIDIKFHAESKFPKCKSYRGLSTQKRFEPVDLTIWHWAQKHTEPFLSLPVDFKFASFTMLAEFVDNITVFMKERPESCFQCDFSASQLLAQVLLNQVTNRTGVVCHWVLKSDSIDLLCCKWDSAGNTVKCNEKVKRSIWMQIIDKILLLSFVLTMLYSPLLLIYLPRHFVGNELSSKFIVQDLFVNPIHEWTKLKLLQCWPRGSSFKSQFRRFIVLIICPMLVCIPFIFYHQLYLRKKLIQQVGESYFDSYLNHFARQLTHTDNFFPKVFYKPVMKYFVYLAFPCYAIPACLLAVCVSDGFECKTCRFCVTYVDCNENGKKFSVPDKMILHASPRAIINFVVSSISWVKRRSHRKPIYMRALLVALLVLTIPLILTAAFLWSLPLTVVYIFLLGGTVFPLTKTREYFLSKMGSIVANISTVLFGILIVLPVMTIGIIMPHLLVVSVVTMLMRSAAYTLIGVLLLGKELLPYISFGIILITNIRSYYNSLTTRYSKLRDFLFEACKKYQENQEKSHQSGPLIYYDNNSSIPVISRKLYNMACDKVMPRLDAVLIFLVKCIITFLLFAFVFSCIKAFARFESGVENIVDSAVTLLAGTLPKLFGLVVANEREDRLKDIHMQNCIDSVIHEFLEEHGHETRERERYQELKQKYQKLKNDHESVITNDQETKANNEKLLDKIELLKKELSLAQEDLRKQQETFQRNAKELRRQVDSEKKQFEKDSNTVKKQLQDSKKKNEKLTMMAKKRNKKQKKEIEELTNQIQLLKAKEEQMQLEKDALTKNINLEHERTKRTLDKMRKRQFQFNHILNVSGANFPEIPGRTIPSVPIPDLGIPFEPPKESGRNPEDVLDYRDPSPIFPLDDALNDPLPS